jgi:putative FmdB family regulatory protein
VVRFLVRISFGEEFILPLYEYECEKCGHRFEKIENVSALPTKKCPKCGGKAERLLAAPAIQFKGSGWYVSDYGGKSAGRAGEKAEEKSAEKPTEKSAATPEGDSSGKKGSASKEKGTKGKKD